jgi:hypothetical protein
VKRFVLIAIILLLSLFMIACSADAPATPEQEINLTAATAPLPHLLPEGTLLAVEFHDLARRWSEIRAVRPLVQLQDRLLAAAGLTPDVVPVLAGDHAVFALVTGSRDHALVPIVLLKPLGTQVGVAAESLGPNWSMVRARGALWVAPTEAVAALRRIAVGDGTSLAGAQPLDEMEDRLPPGGLVRGWINPSALKPLLRGRIQVPLSGLVHAIAASLAAELEVVRWIGFRRDLEPGRLVGDAITVYDLRRLPNEIARVLDPGATAVRLPASVPEDVVLAAVFRPEAGAALPWLHFVAAQDRESPLRNIGFWVEEFESRFGRSLAHGLFGAIGERAWFLILRPGPAGSHRWALAFESPQPRLVEATVLDLLDWSADHAWPRTLGLAVPRVRILKRNGVTIHEVTIRTPFGEAVGPVFAASAGFFVVAAAETTLLRATAVLENGAFTLTANEAEQSTAAHASLWLRGTALAGAVESVLALDESEAGCRDLAQAVGELLSGVSFVSARAWYESDAVRMHGELQLGDQH